MAQHPTKRPALRHYPIMVAFRFQPTYEGAVGSTRNVPRNINMNYAILSFHIPIVKIDDKQNYSL